MTRLSIALALCLSTTRWSAAQELPPPVISVHSDLVVLQATVVDRRSTPVGGLPQDVFQVYEDGVAQDITFFSSDDAPVSAGLVVDNSGSMVRKRSHVIGAALAFAAAGNPADELFVVHFADSAALGMPPDAPFTSDLGVVRQALGRLRSNGQTSLYDGIALALSHLQAARQDRRVLVVISDGADNASETTLDEVLDRARASNAVIYTIGIFDEYDDADRGVLRRLARLSGGEAYFPKDLDDVERTLRQVAADIRSGYTIGYVPTNTRRDGAFRAVRVAVKVPGRPSLSVRVREGYKAPGAAGAEDR
jgi:VWFA-related protein